MRRRLFLALTALSLTGLVGAAPAALAGGPSITVGPVTINGNPGCC